MVEKYDPKRDQEIEEKLKKKLKERREILKDFKEDIPDISKSGTPLEHVTHKHDIDIEDVKRKRKRFFDKE